MLKLYRNDKNAPLEPKYKTFNLSLGKPHLSQRNNAITPNWTCNTTAMCMGLKYSGYSFPSGQYEQPEDNLTYFCQHDQRVLDYYQTNYPNEYAGWVKDPNTGYTPNEVHAVLSYATNLWIGKTCTYWNGETDLSAICEDLRNGLPVVLSALFGTLNHIVCAVGIKYLYNDREYINPQRLIYDDPWGLTYNYQEWPYASDDNEIVWSKVLADIKPVGNTKKWSHRFYKA